MDDSRFMMIILALFFLLGFGLFMSLLYFSMSFRVCIIWLTLGRIILLLAINFYAGVILFHS